MQQTLLARAIAGMAKEVTVDEFCVGSGIASRLVAKDILAFLISRGIGQTDGHALFFFSSLDRVKAAVLAIGSGCDPEQVSLNLTWKDFENLVSQTLSLFGYKTHTNVRLARPRMEIDVVGQEGGFAVAFDCKHWKKTNLYMISRYCSKQAARVQELVRQDDSITHAVPAVLTLHAEHLSFSNNVPIVPVSKLTSFLTDLRSFLPDVCLVTMQEPAGQ